MTSETLSDSPRPAHPGPDDAELSPRMRRRAVLASVLGNGLEWFDFVAYVVMDRKSRVPRIEWGLGGRCGVMGGPRDRRNLAPRLVLIEGPDTRTVASAGRTFDDPGAGPALVKKAGTA